MQMEFVFLVSLVLVAFIYSSVGHGGASGYLAIMAIFGVEMVLMKPSALILNLFVSSIAFSSFYRGGHFRPGILLPFIITSIPMAFLGASMEISPGLYKKILALCLLISAARIFLRKPDKAFSRRHLSVPVALATGAVVGFFSGLIGIGGGIVLSPLLLMTNWANMKETAAISAAFIFLNSLSGLTGHVIAGMEVSPSIIMWVIFALGGGLAGSYASSFRFSYIHLKHLITLVLLIASLKLYIF